MTRRVVVTGIGIISCIGNDQDEVAQSLKEGRSGIVFSEKYAEMGFRSQVEGRPNITLEDKIDRKLLRFMGDGAAYNYLAMEQAIKDAGLEEKDISHERTGLVMGSGGPSTKNLMQAHDIARTGNPKRVGPYRRYHDLIVDAYGDPGEDYPITIAHRLDRMPRIQVDDVLEKVELWARRYRATAPAAETRS